MTRAIAIPDDVLNRLAGLQYPSANAVAIAEKLERPQYEAVSKVLEALGGKWSRAAKAIVFPEPAAPLIESVILTGTYSRTKQDFGQFMTPAAIVDLVIGRAEIEPGMLVLEPSAGTGNLVLAAEAAGASVAGVEVDAKLLHTAKERCVLALGIKLSDFLSMPPLPMFDRVVMNPPFAGQADIDHVLHAAKFVKPGGKLVAIMSAGTLFRTNRKAVEFREWVGQHAGWFVRLPDAAFAESGTQVNTCMVDVTL